MTELVVMLLVGMAAIAGVWALFRAGVGHGKRTDARLRGVQGAHLLVQQLEHDLKRIYTEAPGFLVRIAPPPDAALAFHVFDEERSEPEGLRIRVKRIVYRYDSKKGIVSRQEEGGPRKVFRDRYERVVFGQPPFDGSVESGALPYGRLVPVGTETALPAVNPNLLCYQVTCVPEGCWEKAPKDREVHERTTVCGGVLMPKKAMSQKFHAWMPNLSSYPER